MDLLKPKEVTVRDRDGIEHKFNISRLPATVGREVLAKYPITNLPKIGEYPASEAIMLKMMGYVEKVRDDGSTIRLTTKALVDNHVPDAQALARLEMGMIEYNFDFFDKGKSSGFLNWFIPKAKPLITSMLTDLSAALSQAGKHPSKS